MSESLLAPTFLFRFSTACHSRKELWSDRSIKLSDKYLLPSFSELDGRKQFAELRAAWNKEGLLFVVQVAGKKQPPWCRPTRMEDSDGLQIWIDTRDSRGVHRANRFCHRFQFLPAGGGHRLDEPIGALFPINRAKESPKPVEAELFRVRSTVRPDGYTLEAMIPAAALTGWNPADHRRLGFTYAVVDRELGWQTFTVGPEFPFVEDPTLWGTLELAS
ncbi:MAG: sugar-binding protein [Planctomycetota bacterium]